jgi:hypothetical protein
MSWIPTGRWFHNRLNREFAAFYSSRTASNGARAAPLVLALRAGLAKLLSSADGFRIVAQCQDRSQLCRAVETYRSAIVIYSRRVRTHLYSQFDTAASDSGSLECGRSRAGFGTSLIRIGLFRRVSNADV